MRAIIDRLEDGVAVVVFENGGRAYVPASDLPPGAGEGTALRLSWSVDEEADATEVAELIDRLRRRSEDHL